MEIFIERVRRLQNALAPNSLLLIPAARPAVRNRDTLHRYRAHSDTLYLTGVNEEGLTLALTPEKFFVFAATHDNERERWTGKVCGHEFFRERFSTECFALEVIDAKEWLAKFIEIARGKEILYYDFGVDFNRDKEVLSALSENPQFARKGVYTPRTMTRASTLLSELRLHKDAGDLEFLRQAAKISSMAHNRTMDLIEAAAHPLTEFEVKAAIEHAFMAEGADELAYPSIVAAGANATVLHYESTKGRASVGEFFLIDAAAEFEGYASDITRTTAVGGIDKAPAFARSMHALVKQAQKEAIAASLVGATIDAVHEKAVEVLSRGLFEAGLFERVPQRNAEGKFLSAEMTRVSSLEEVKEKKYYELFYMHRTSHFMGLDVHDVGDYFVEGKSRALAPGMVLTVEPGLYFPAEYDFLLPEARGVGIRIEDDVLVTAEGNEILTAECR